MRRLHHSLALLALIATPALPAAAAFPEKPIAIVVPFGAGDAIDGTARVMADQLSDELGVPVIVKNIAGAGGGKGTAEAAKAEPDGYTLLMASTGATTARPLIAADAGYSTDDFVPLAQLVEVPIGLAVAADSEFQSIDDIVEAAKASPGAVKYSTPGPGSTQHINMERFAGEQGIELTHIGGQGGKGAVTKTLSGEVDFAFVGASNYTSLADAGKLRVLGVAAPEPVDYLPDAPTFRSQGYDFDVAVWFGLVTNSGTPEETVETLRAAIEKVATAEATEELYQKFHFESAYLDAAAFDERIRENVAMHGLVLKEIGLIQ